MGVQFHVRCLIFDCDGLMFDNEMPGYLFWQEIYEAHGCSFSPETWLDTDFDPWQNLQARSKGPVDFDAIRTRIVLAGPITSAPLLPGVMDYINEAKMMGLVLAVTSNSNRQWVLDFLTYHGIADKFDCLMCREEGILPKPHPELYQRVLTKLGLGPAEAIALEDSPNGIRAAKAAGIFCVAVPNALTCQLSLDHADLCLSSLQEIPLQTLLTYRQSRIDKKIS